jgi:DNA-binding NtrC family response regulator
MLDTKHRILLVDDEKNIRLTLSHVLETEGYQVATAVNGEDALQQMQEQEYDLLLLDLKMPGIDGMAVLHRVVELYPNTKVVIVTAHGTVENAVEAVKLGAIDFIQKPFSPQEIRTLVAQVFDREHLEERQAADYATHLELAKRSINGRHFHGAAQHVRQAIASDPSRPEAFNLLGVLQEIQGNHHAALANYRIALDLDPTYNAARQNLQRSSSFPGSGPHHYNLE